MGARRVGPRCFACDKAIRRTRAKTYPEAFCGQGVTYPARWEGYVLIEGDKAPAFCKTACAFDFAAVFVRGGHRVSREGANMTGGERPAPA